MNRQLITTGVILSALDAFNTDSLVDRILLQKKIYLIQRLGIPLGYRFSWYIYGPYCPELTSIAYECNSIGQEVFKTYTLNENVVSKVELINSLYSQCADEDMNKALWYELVASCAFWQDKGLSDDLLVEKIYSEKPKFSKEQITLAVHCLQNILEN
jgi:uncharacterized protein YwgA